MKVYIGKYKTEIYTRKLVSFLRVFGVSRAKTIAIGELIDDKFPFVQNILKYINHKRERKIKIVIDRWDTWSADHTLALIILPVLKQLHKEKHGAPAVSDEDVPEHLRSTSAPKKEDEHDIDANHFKRWDYVMNEMIWAFEQILDDDWAEQFYTGVSDVNFIRDIETNTYTMVHGKNHTRRFDKEGYMKYDQRINNGLILFGKYFRGLWD